MPIRENPDRIFALLRRGDWFGGLPQPLQHQLVENSNLHRFDAGASITHQDRPVANSRVLAMLLPQPVFQRMLQDDPTIYRLFAEQVLERYRITLRIFAQSLTMDPEAFFQVRLAALISRWRKDGYREPVIEIELSQAAAARMLGLSRQTFNRYLSRLEAQGVIETSFRTIRVLQPDLLCAKVAAL